MESQPPVDGHCDDRFAQVREVFTENLKSGRDCGAAVSFSLDGETVIDLWGGFLDLEHTRPWQRDTLVNVYSTTKGMTALCAHQLAERGLLDFDAPVAQYWPEFAAQGKQDLPVRWLMSHRAGLPAIREVLPHAALYDWEEMTRALANTEPWWEPGTDQGYHALTFGHLVGEVIRRVSGQSVGTFFKENVAGPLEADFHIGFGPELDARTSDLHGQMVPSAGSARAGSKASPSPEIPDAVKTFMRNMSDPNTMAGAAFNNPRQRSGDVNTRAWRAAEIPAANGHGTARSLARIYGALARGGEIDGIRILEPETVDRAIEEQSHGPDAILGQMPLRFGLGFMLRSPVMPLSPSRRAFGHPGAGGSIGMADPDARVGFGYTLNKMQMGLTGGAGGFAMLRAFYDAL
ncbi:MAG: serine hydrolase [Myxococcota bacterium]|nr:serine hydrolase [Myxococcota bacterium]